MTQRLPDKTSKRASAVVRGDTINIAGSSQTVTYAAPSDDPAETDIRTAGGIRLTVPSGQHFLVIPAD